MKTSRRNLRKFMVIRSAYSLSKDLDPFFYELILDSINNPKISFPLKNGKLRCLKISNKTLAKLNIYLNIFSNLKLNTQTNLKLNRKITKPSSLYSITKNRFLTEVNNRELNSQLAKHLFFDTFLKRKSNGRICQVIKCLQRIENFQDI